MTPLVIISNFSDFTLHYQHVIFGFYIYHKLINTYFVLNLMYLFVSQISCLS